MIAARHRHWRQALRLSACGAVVGIASAGCADVDTQHGDPVVESTTGPAAPTSAEPGHHASSHTIYVPAYGSLRTSGKTRPSFAITLSIRNIDPEATIALDHVDYYDTPGHKVRSFLAKRRVLRPLQTVEYFVPADEKSGGSGANFLIHWEGNSQARGPLAESIMIGYATNGYVTFTSRGIPLDVAPRTPAAPASTGGEPATAPTPEVTE